MPAVGFICEDGEEILKDSCLSECRMGRRCMALPSLRVLAREREWKGQLSVTELERGPLYHYLRITEAYSVSPFDKTFALIGTNHHTLMEGTTAIGEMSELSFVHPLFRGTVDLITPDEDNPGWFVITDYKTFGSYRAGQVLGKCERLVESDTEYYQASGTVKDRQGNILRRYKRGQPKIIKEYYFDDDEADLDSLIWQLNCYRLGVQEGRDLRGNELNIPISKLMVQITVRDYGAMARSNGFDRPVYYREIPIVQDDWVRHEAAKRQQVLQAYLDTGEFPDRCTDEQTWNGLQCKSFCEVRYICPHGNPGGVD